MSQEQKSDSRPFKIRNSNQEGFEWINRATVESGIIPQLDSMLGQHSVNTEYWIFDGVEFTMGFPTPVRICYVVPSVDEFTPDLEKDHNFVGIAVHEWFLNGHSTSICVGLSLHDMDKIVQRHHAVYRERDYPKPVKPDWWIYEYLAYDFTRPPRLVLSRNPNYSKNPFVYGDYDVDRMENIATINFEEEGKEKARKVWPENRSELAEAMNKLDSLIGQVVERNQSK